MASVETEIWNIFTFYTLHGNPLDPEHIRVRALLLYGMGHPAATQHGATHEGAHARGRPAATQLTGDCPTMF